MFAEFTSDGAVTQSKPFDSNLVLFKNSLLRSCEIKENIVSPTPVPSTEFLKLL